MTIIKRTNIIDDNTEVIAPFPDVHLTGFSQGDIIKMSYTFSEDQASIRIDGIVAYVEHEVRRPFKATSIIHTINIHVK